MAPTRIASHFICRQTTYKKGLLMRATIWARQFIWPAGFCYNCNAPSTTSVFVWSQGGIASTIASHGLEGAALAALATSGSPHQVTYCRRCAVTAHTKPPDRVAEPAGLLLVALGFGAIAWFTTGTERIVTLAVALAALGGLAARLRYVHRPLHPGQTTRWQALAVLNEGRDLLNSNREFVSIEFSNQRVVDEILQLNPGVEVTSQ